MTGWTRPVKPTQAQLDATAVEAIRRADPAVLQSRSPADWAAIYRVDRKLAEYEIGLRMRRAG